MRRIITITIEDNGSRIAGAEVDAMIRKGTRQFLDGNGAELIMDGISISHLRIHGCEVRMLATTTEA